jgi:alanine racemase
VRIRQLGWKKPVLLLEDVFTSEDVKTASEYCLNVAVHCNEQLELIDSAKTGVPININLKMNSR